MKATFLPPDDPGIGDALRQDGVAYIQDLLTAEQIERWRAELHRYETEVLPAIRRSNYDSDPSGRLVMYRDVQRYDPWFDDEIRRPRLMDLVRSAVDWEPVVYYLDGFPKPAGATAIEAHQELYTVPVNPPQLLHLWIPLEDVNPVNGGINFYHGTHKLGLAPHVELPGVAPQVDPAVLKRIEGLRVEVHCPAGSAALFDGRTIHWSGPNTGDRNRPAVTIGIRGKDTEIMSEEANIASMLARLFRETLGIAGFGRDEDLYQRGGTDEDARRILAGVRQNHEVEIPLAEFSAAYATPDKLAARIVQIQGEAVARGRWT